MEEPTKPMLREAADAGFYTSPAGTQHPRLQILTVEQLLNGQKLDLPAWHDVRTFKKAPKAKGTKRNDIELFCLKSVPAGPMLRDARQKENGQAHAVPQIPARPSLIPSRSRFMRA